MTLTEAIDELAKVTQDPRSRQALRVVENELDRLRQQVAHYRDEERDRRYGPDL